MHAAVDAEVAGFLDGHGPEIAYTTAFALMTARLIWHLYTPPPAPLGGGWQATAAKAVHWTIYALMLAIPLSGWIGSSATGIDTVIFNRLTLPAIAHARRRVPARHPVRAAAAQGDHVVLAGFRRSRARRRAQSACHIRISA